jgi:hypothetical protein
MMKNILYLSVLLVTSIGYSQDKVSSNKSNTPIEAVIVKMPTSKVNVNQKKVVEKNDIVSEKQTTPVLNRIVNYIGTPKTNYVEPIAVVKKDKP